jgi:hypothetical protein
MSHEEEDTWMFNEGFVSNRAEEDTCMSHEEEDTWMFNEGFVSNRAEEDTCICIYMICEERRT